MIKIIAALSLLVALAQPAFAQKILGADMGTSSSVGGAISQLVHTEQIYDSTNSQLLSTTIASVGTQPAQVIPGSNVINWATGDVFTQALTANTTYTFSGQVSGDIIVVRLLQTGSNTFTVTWPSGVCWTGGASFCTGTPPVMTTGSHADIYTFVYDGTNIFGTPTQNY